MDNQNNIINRLFGLKFKIIAGVVALLILLCYWFVFSMSGGNKNNKEDDEDEIKPTTEFSSEGQLYYGGTIPLPFSSDAIVHITSYMGGRTAPLPGASVHHKGLDMVVTGTTTAPIYAVADGKVKCASYGWNGKYGNLIEITHANGIETRYAHLSNIVVRTGEEVKAGQYIGNEGGTGNVTGPHLHFELRKNGKALNPEYYFLNKSDDLGFSYQSENNDWQNQKGKFYE